MRIEFRLLGPLEVVEDGQPLPLGGPQERALLALLLLRRNRALSREGIITELWDGAPPRSAANVIQKHVSRLRKLLGAHILTTDSGYLLRVARDQVDADRFADLVSEGRAATGERAVALLDEALGLWRDAPLSDLVLGSGAARDADALEEQRAAAHEERIDLLLERGRAGELVVELRELVRRYPVRERLRGQLMLALYRSDRQADALAAYRDARRELVEALAIEPSESLRELERRILVHDGALALPGPTTSSSPAVVEAPDERRAVGMLVLQVGGRDGRELDVEEVDDLIAQWSEHVIGHVSRFGGTIERRFGDTLYAAFGSQTVHEDDAERAVRAALACRDALDREELELHAGIAFGDVLVRHRGETFEIHGDAASTAARLAAAAPAGAIVATERVRRATAHAVEYRAARSTASAWEVLAATHEPGADLLRSGRARFVGRERELAALTGAVARTRDEGRPQIVTLIGAPGIGKSRLVLELRRAFDSRAVAWFEGRSAPYGDGLAFWPLAQIVKRRAGILDSDGPRRASERLRATVLSIGATNADWMVEQLEPLVAGTRAAPSELGRDSAFAAWLRFFEMVARETPLVLVFEDVHWADEGTLDFLAHLGASVVDAPLLVLSTARPEFLERRPGWGVGAREVTSIALDPLGTSDVTELLTAVLGGTPGEELLPWLLDRVGGNPLFADEFARVLVEGAMVERDVRGTWRLRADGAAQVLPDSVNGIIAARIDALPNEPRALLRDAAVVGRVFWADAVAALTGGSSEPEAPLRVLARRDFVQREPGSRFAGQEQYAFKHALICDLAYGQLRRDARAVKHGQVAEWLETQTHGEDAAELIAHHRWHAFELSDPRDPELVRRTLDSLARAGERARSLHANAEAASYFRRALDLADREGANLAPEPRARLEESLGDAVVLGDPDAGRSAYERALRLIPPAARLQQAQLHRKRGASHLSHQHRGVSEAFAAYAQAEAALGPVSDRQPREWWEERIELEFDRLQHLYFTADAARYSAAVELAMPVVRRHGTPLQNARIGYHIAAAQARRDQYVIRPESVDAVRRGLATVEATGNITAICSWRFTLGTMLVWSSRPDEAEEQLRSSLELAAMIGDAARRVRARNYLAVAHRMRGDVGSTEEDARTTLSEASRAQMPPYVKQAHAHLGWAMVKQQRWAEASEHVSEAWAKWRTGSPQEELFMWMVLWPRLALALALDRGEEAVDCARGLLIPECQPPQQMVADNLTRAVATADRGDRDAACALLAETIELHGVP